MPSNVYLLNRNLPTLVSGNRMGSHDRARASEGMRPAMALGELTLDAVARVRGLLSAVGQAVRRGMARRATYTKNGVVHID